MQFAPWNKRESQSQVEVVQMSARDSSSMEINPMNSREVKMNHIDYLL